MSDSSLPVGARRSDSLLPRKLRDAAYLIDKQFNRLRSGDELVSRILYAEADRLERKQAEDAARDHAVEKAARMIVDRVYGFSWGDAEESERADAKRIARALADAGLLNTGEQ